jgi:CRP-like cAMP-binding protein
MVAPSPALLEDLHFLSKIKRAEVQRAAAYFEMREFGAGERVVTVDEPARGLGILVGGQLGATVGDRVVYPVVPVELVGEDAAFLPTRKYAADLDVVEPCEIAWISLSALERLREDLRPVYDALLTEATLASVRRVRALSVLIAREARGEVKAPSRQQASRLSKLWRALVPGGPAGKCPPLPPLLRKVPGLEQADSSSILGLAQCFTAKSFQEGEVLFLEGDTGDTLYLLAEGEVDVLRCTGVNRAVLLTTLGTGTLLGINALVEPGHRTASCVTRTAGWAYTTDSRTFHNPPAAASTVWRESVMLDLATQLQRSSSNFAQAVGHPSTLPDPPDESSDIVESTSGDSVLPPLPPNKEGEEEEAASTQAFEFEDDDEAWD